MSHHAPEQLVVDEYEGAAWVGLTPFVTADVRPPAVPAFLPGLPTSAETNLRTYVRHPHGLDGLWFLSLGIACLLMLGVWKLSGRDAVRVSGRGGRTPRLHRAGSAAAVTAVATVVTAAVTAITTVAVTTVVAAVVGVPAPPVRRGATLVARSAPPSAVFEAVTREVGLLLCGADLARMERYESDGALRRRSGPYGAL
ncbi:DUF2071 domain-containing protein [Streptomyces sp. NPDC002896]|uniref:DUF2071 domain-containing protein n=1 Tax=Streptomyces sp. NPDC002896 TaxID=3154438 RepID=UPI00332B2092